MTPEIKRFPVKAKGVGREDYSMATEFSVQSAILSYQQRYFWSLSGLVPAGPLGLQLSFLDSEDILRPYGTDVPTLIYDIIVSTSRHSLLYIDIRSYNLALGDMRPIAENEGYGRAHIIFKNGLKVEENRIYVILVWDLGGAIMYMNAIAYGVRGQKETI